MEFQPGILSLINNSAQQYGVDPAALQRIAWLESRGNPAAKNPNSSASGLFQFINSTAKQYGLSDPFDAGASADAGARLARDNAAHLRRTLGRDPSGGELYLAHQQGAGGAAKLLSNPNARAIDVVGRDAVKLNGGNENMTAGEFANLWINKAGGGPVNTLVGGDYTPPADGGTNMQGLLGAFQQRQDDRPIGQRLRDSAKDGSLFDALAMGFNTMRGPMADQGLAQSVGSRIEQRQSENQRNLTAEWLAQQGRGDLADALVNGMITGEQAFAAMQPKEPQYEVINDQLVQIGPNGPQVMGDYRSAPEQFQTITGEQAAGMGLDPNNSYNLGPDGKVTQIGGGGTNVTVNNAGADKFAEEFAKGDAASLVAIGDAGLAAQRNIGRIDQLESLMSQSPTGWQAAAAQRAGEWGINTEGLDQIQAAQAMINSLVPEQRQPGSGPMSDADLDLFKQSLPRIINQPGGNQVIVNTMRAIAQYDAEGAAIVQRLRAGEIDRSQAFDMLQSRQNPLANFQAAQGQQAGSEQQAAPQRRRYNPATGEFE